MDKLKQIRQSRPEWGNLTDAQVVDLVHTLDYSDLPKEQVARALGVDLNKAVSPDSQGRGALGWANDIGISALRGAIAVPEAAVGLADMVSGGRAGKALEQVGFRPKEAKDILAYQYTDQTKQALSNVQASQGIMGTLGAVAENPSVIPLSIAESVPLMGGGGAVARGVMKVVPRLGALGAGAIGEGVVSAGSSAEQIRQQTSDGMLTGPQAALSGGIGALTAGLGALGGKVAKRLGIADVDTMIAQGARDTGVSKGIVRSALEGAASEGLLEELPQSVQEQALQNLALGKPIEEGVDQAAVMGALTGAAMGGAAGAFARPRVPDAGPLSRAANTALDQREKEQAAQSPLLALPAPTIRVTEGGQAITTDPRMGGILDVTPVASAREAEDAAILAAARAAQQSPEQAMAQSQANIAMMAGRQQPTSLDMAQARVAGLAEQAGIEASVIPHPGGRGFMVIPSAWVAEPMRQQVAQGQQAGMLPGPDMAAPDGPLVADPQGLRPQTYAEQQAARQAVRDVLDDRDRMVQMGLTPDVERAQRTRALAQIQPGDITTPKGGAFKTEGQAKLVGRKKGVTGELVQVRGGWVFRPAAQTIEDTTNGATGNTAGVAERPGADAGPAIGAGVADVGPDADAAVRRVDTAADRLVADSAGDLSGRNAGGRNEGGVIEQDAPQAAAGESAPPAQPQGADARGPGQDAAGAQAAGVPGAGRAADVQAAGLKPKAIPAFLKTKTVPQMTAEELREAQAYYGPNHKRAKAIEKALAKIGPQQAESGEGEKLPPTDIRDGDKVLVDGEVYTVTGSLKEGRKNVGVVADRDSDADPLNGVKRVMLRGDDAIRAKIAADNLPAVKPSLSVEFGGKTYPVDSVEDAQQKWVKFQETAGAGVSQVGNGVEVKDQTGKVVGRISYNGRAWDADGNLVAEAPAQEAPKNEDAPRYDPAKDPLADKRAQAVLAREKDAAPALEAKPQPETQPTEGAEDGRKVQGQAPAEEVSPKALPSLKGEKIDDDWTAFSKESGTLGIPRSEMPQIKAEHRGALVNFINARGIGHESDEVPPDSLKPTQAEFSPEKVEKARESDGDRSILVSEDDHVLDGHHQWVAKYEDGEPVKVIRLKAPIRELLNVVAEFPSAEQAAGSDTLATADPANAIQDGGQPAAEQSDETPQITEAEARKRLEWRDLGQSDGTKTWGLYFKDADGGTLRYGTVSKYAGSRWEVESHDGGKYEGLQPAKKKAEDIAVERLRRDGYVAPAEAVATSEAKTEAPARKKATKPEEKITDFGEKLEGARKDYALTLKDAMEVDVKTAPLSKSWPEPDYQKLLDGGADPFAVSFIHAARDEVPTKPVKAWKLKGWVAQVEMLRDMAQKILSGEVSPQRLREMLAEPKFERLRSRVGGRAELYEAVGHEKSLKGVDFEKHDYALYRGEQNVTKWVISQEAKATAFSNWPREIVAANSKEEALAQFKAKYDDLDLGPKAKGQSQFSIYRRRGAEGAIIGKKIGREYIDLKKLADVKEARAYLQDNLAELEKALEQYKTTPLERRPDNQPRVGDDHRNGAPVTPEVFAETFGFRGVQFGNYVEQARRQSDLNEAYDALMDLAAVLGVPPRALSLNGSLGLAFGARGKGGKGAPNAHFEGDKVVINLTKAGGPGSLAHEWWHSVDNYFARQSVEKSTDFVTGGAVTDRMRQKLREAFAAVKAATQAPTLRRRAALLDKRKSKPYWNTPIELSARAFESYVIAKLRDQGAANDYLANIVDPEVWGVSESMRAEALGQDESETYPYPLPAELPAVRAAFDDFFKTVETRTDDAGNVAMFNRQEEGDGFRRESVDMNPLAKESQVTMIENIVNSLVSRWKNAPEVVVLASMAEAPARVREENERQIAGGAQGVPEGFFYGGKAYIMASEVKTIADVRRVLFHEVLGHLGLRGLYGEQLDKIRAQVWNVLRKEVVEKGLSYGLDMNERRDQLLAAEEVLAEMAQTNPSLGFVRRAIAAIRSWLRANVPALSRMKMTDDEIINEFIIPAQRFIKRGPQGPDGRMAPAFRRRDAGMQRSEKADIGFSRAAAAEQYTGRARELAQDFLGSAGTKVDWLDRTFKTQYAKAQKFPEFGKVFNRLQQYIESVSSLANQAADRAPSILPKLESVSDLWKHGIWRHGLKAEDKQAIAAPIFEGTLEWARKDGALVRVAELEKEAEGLTTAQKEGRLLRDRKVSPEQVKAWKASKLDVYDGAIRNAYEREYLAAGVVFTDAELRDRFSLTPEQIGQYREFRAAVNESLDEMAAAEVVRLVPDLPSNVSAMAETAEGRKGLREAVEAFLGDENNDLWNQVQDKFNQVEKLKERGYAPLSRFGKFYVHVVDAAGATQFFGLAETHYKANALAREMRGAFPDATVDQGVMSQQQYKLMSAVPLDSMELFASAIGAEQSEVFQKYIQLAKNNRSTMKRLIRRKGTAGFSDDVPRVLANFVTSNARAASAALHVKTAKEMAQEIQAGDVKDEAVKLIEAVTEPEESGAAIRGLMFTNFIGGSIASAVVNVTQPFMMTFPYLSQWGGARKAAARLVEGARMAVTRAGGDAELRAALKRAEDDGIVSPQEIHHLIERAVGGLADKNPVIQKLAFVWGAPFSLAEQFNRRASFIAAYRTAKEEGIADPFQFAEKAVIETQGLYTAANKPNWARGVAGATAMTFKQYSIHYLEWLSRMARSGKPGQKAALLALAMLFLAAGADGLPFMDDMDDVIDTAGQAMGYDTNTKRWRHQAASAILGDELGEVATRGFSAIGGFPLDVSMRMGMGNLLPATDLLMKSNTDTARSLSELAGPGGALFMQYRDAAKLVLSGDIGAAAQRAFPVALQNVSKGAQMALTGEYRDQRDRKVTDADLLDAGVKALGFQPAEIARESGRMADLRQSESLARMTEAEITDKWARAIVDGDREAEKEALAMRDDWNEKNPDMPIVVKRSQAIRKARQMRMDRKDRFLKTVAPERRKAAQQEMDA